MSSGPRNDPDGRPELSNRGRAFPAPAPCVREIAVDGGSLRVRTVGNGVIEPSAEEGTLRGSVIWAVEGYGRLSGATGLVTSNFEFQPERGTAAEHQVVRLFLP